MFKIDLFIEEFQDHKYLGTRIYFSKPEKDGVHISTSCVNNPPPNFFNKLSRKDRSVLLQTISSSIEICIENLLKRKDFIENMPIKVVK